MDSSAHIKRFAAQCALAALALAAAGAYFFFMPQYQPMLPTTTIVAGDAPIEVELATTQAEQNQGLSGRASLPEGKGMLFVFDSPGSWGIWMKDMKFAIDIIWANEDGTIVTIDKNVSPDTYPNSFTPASPASYVLEVPAGFSDRHGLAVGQQIVVK